MEEALAMSSKSSTLGGGGRGGAGRGRGGASAARAAAASGSHKVGFSARTATASKAADAGAYSVDRGTTGDGDAGGAAGGGEHDDDCAVVDDGEDVEDALLGLHRLEKDPFYAKEIDVEVEAALELIRGRCVRLNMGLIKAACLEEMGPMRAASLGAIAAGGGDDVALVQAILAASALRLDSRGIHRIENLELFSGTLTELYLQCVVGGGRARMPAPIVVGMTKGALVPCELECAQKECVRCECRSSFSCAR